jgi:hypothetical protein
MNTNRNNKNWRSKMGGDDYVSDENGTWSGPNSALAWYRIELTACRKRVQNLQNDLKVFKMYPVSVPIPPHLQPDKEGISQERLEEIWSNCTKEMARDDSDGPVEYDACRDTLDLLAEVIRLKGLLHS